MNSRLVIQSLFYCRSRTPTPYTRLSTPLRGFPPCFMKKFSFNDYSVCPGRCGLISFQVLSSRILITHDGQVHLSLPFPSNIIPFTIDHAIFSRVRGIRIMPSYELGLDRVYEL